MNLWVCPVRRSGQHCCDSMTQAAEGAPDLSASEPVIWANAEATTALLRQLLDQPTSAHLIEPSLFPPDGLRDVHVVALYARTSNLQRDFGASHGSRALCIRTWLFHLLGGQKAGLSQLINTSSDGEARWTGVGCERLAATFKKAERGSRDAVVKALRVHAASDVDSYAAVAEARKAYHAVVRAPSKGWLDSACRRWKAVTVKPNSVPLGTSKLAGTKRAISPNTSLSSSRPRGVGSSPSKRVVAPLNDQNTAPERGYLCKLQPGGQPERPPPPPPPPSPMQLAVEQPPAPQTPRTIAAPSPIPPTSDTPVSLPPPLLLDRDPSAASTPTMPEQPSPIPAMPSLSSVPSPQLAAASPPTLSTAVSAT